MKKKKPNIQEQTGKDPLYVIKEKEEKENKIKEKLNIKKKLKKRKITKYKNSYIQAICEVDEITPRGYILKIIENPTTQNLDYSIHDYLEYVTFNEKYKVGDIILYTFDYPYTQKSRLI